jgi:hypothetical protein
MSRHDLPAQLIKHAQGLHAASAAIELLCAHHAWLDKPAFVSRYAITGTRTSGEPYAYIDWNDAITALDAGHIHGSGSENNILRIAASLGGPGIPVQLACVLGNLDLTNIGLVTEAIVRANGSPRPAPPVLRPGQRSPASAVAQRAAQHQGPSSSTTRRSAGQNTTGVPPRRISGK